MTQLVTIEQSKADAAGKQVINMLGSIGEAIGTYAVSKVEDQRCTIEIVETALRAAMDNGLQVEDLKASSKNVVSPCYEAILQSMDAVRELNGLCKMKATDKTRRTCDNYFSRIRAFVRARGAEPLDLFGNIAAKKAEDEKKLAAEQSAQVVAKAKEAGAKKVSFEAKESPKKDDAKQKESSDKMLTGVAGALEFFKEWTARNPQPSFERYALVMKDVEKMFINMAKADGLIK